MMTQLDSNSELDRALAVLSTYDAPPERVEAIGLTCRSALERRRRRTASYRRLMAWERRLEACLALGLAALYLAGAIERALEIMR